jgi:hypothetical protein
MQLKTGIPLFGGSCAGPVFVTYARQPTSKHRQHFFRIQLFHIFLRLIQFIELHQHTPNKYFYYKILRHIFYFSGFQITANHRSEVILTNFSHKKLTFFNLFLILHAYPKSMPNCNSIMKSNRPQARELQKCCMARR